MPAYNLVTITFLYVEFVGCPYSLAFCYFAGIVLNILDICLDFGEGV